MPNECIAYAEESVAHQRAPVRHAPPGQQEQGPRRPSCHDAQSCFGFALTPVWLCSDQPLPSLAPLAPLPLIRWLPCSCFGRWLCSFESACSAPLFSLRPPAHLLFSILLHRCSSGAMLWFRLCFSSTHLELHAGSPLILGLLQLAHSFDEVILISSLDTSLLLIW